MKQEIYIVNAYRNGKRDQHSYSLGVFNKKAQAIKCADSHADYRGGKYACVVEKCLLDKFHNDDYDYTIEIYRAKSQAENREEIEIEKFKQLNK
jgi:hypothetical protein